MDGTTARHLFDDNAATYDRVNSIVSLGLDSRWRAWAASAAVDRTPAARVLDAYCGSGLVGLEAARRGAVVTFADVSPSMLTVAARRCARRHVSASFVLTDLAEDDPPLPRAGFDAVTVVFGVRYMEDAGRELKRLATMLAPGGRLVVVEFVPPHRRRRLPSPLSRIAEAYFFGVLPHLASRLAGSPELYEYLADSTRRIDGAERIDGYLHEAGLYVSRRARMGFGLVYGVVAVP